MKNHTEIYDDRAEYQTANYVDASRNDGVFRFLAFFNGRITVHCMRANMEEGWIETLVASTEGSAGSVCDYLRDENDDTLKIKVHGVVHIVPLSPKGEPLPKE